VTFSSNFAWFSGVYVKSPPGTASSRSDLWNFAGEYSIRG
jgi:hypothetical protein